MSSIKWQDAIINNTVSRAGLPPAVRHPATLGSARRGLHSAEERKEDPQGRLQQAERKDSSGQDLPEATTQETPGTQLAKTNMDTRAFSGMDPREQTGLI